MQRFLLLISFCVCMLSSCGQQDDSSKLIHEPVEKIFTHVVGETELRVVTRQYGEQRDIVMISLHDDEVTAVQSAHEVLKESGGMLIRIENGNKRLVSFLLNNQQYRFDPNRIFSDVGTRMSLQKLSANASPVVVAAVRGFAEFILDLIPKQTKLLIALHNNDEGNLTVDSYRRGGDYVREADEAARKSGKDPDDFFLTTDRRLYKRLREDFNVVLQDNLNGTDDGSLSVYYGRRNLKYVNVEAQSGHVKEQTEMIRRLVEIRQ